MLLSDLESLRSTDITSNALATLASSSIRNVVIVGRRGPLEVAFTIKELRELVNLPNCRPVLEKPDFELSRVCEPTPPIHLMFVSPSVAFPLA
eukprot:m.339239 g.339239  ORF g.339239 m.339239 type:complete len:93 (-) comp55744_c0_seq23:853-1131(-)